MAATSANNLSDRSAMSFYSKVSPLSQPKAFGMSVNSKNCLKCFSGLKAAASASCQLESSFLGKKSSRALRETCIPKAQQQNENFSNNPQPEASYKVAILGAAGGIGQPLSLLIKMSPLVSALHLYDIANVKGVAADISHCNTPSQVLDFTGASELADSLKGVDVVVIPAGVPRKPGMTRDDLFNINASIVRNLIEAVADNCPDAFIHIISNPVNSTVPIAAEVLKQKGVYNAKKLFGVTTLDVVRANTFVAEKKNLKLIDVNVLVDGICSWCGGCEGGTEVVKAKAGAGSATLSMAYAAARFVESSLRALDGDGDVYECCYIQSELTELPFFASRVKLGRKGVEEVISSDLHGLTAYELTALEALKPELEASIETGIMFAHKQTVSG